MEETLGISIDTKAIDISALYQQLFVKTAMLAAPSSLKAHHDDNLASDLAQSGAMKMLGHLRNPNDKDLCVGNTHVVDVFLLLFNLLLAKYAIVTKEKLGAWVCVPRSPL